MTLSFSGTDSQRGPGYLIELPLRPLQLHDLTTVHMRATAWIRKNFEHIERKNSTLPYTAVRYLTLIFCSYFAKGVALDNLIKQLRTSLLLHHNSQIQKTFITFMNANNKNPIIPKIEDATDKVNIFILNCLNAFAQDENLK